MKRNAVLIAVVVLVLAGIALYLYPGRGVATPAGGMATVNVSLSGVAGQKGMLMGALCTSETFLKDCQHYATRHPKLSNVLQFEGAPPGSYAVMVFHDENGNGKLDKAANGMPLEGWGFSRNARGRFGPPAFQDARIELVAGVNNIRLDVVY